MSRCEYPAVIIQDAGDLPGDGFDVVFPDLPGCVSSGRSLDEAARSAAEALSMHLQAMIEAGEAIPSPGRSNDVPDWLACQPVTVVASILVPVEISAAVRSA